MSKNTKDLYKQPSNMSPPAVVGCRPDDDVELLLESARRDNYGGNWNAILNRCARVALTPIYGGKRVRAIQEKLGLVKTGKAV